MRHSRRFIPRPATVIAALALLLSVTAGATAANLITGSEVKNGSLRGIDVKDRSLSGADVRKGSLPAGALSPSARRNLGSPGTTGPQGPPGEAGPAGVSDLRLFAAESRNVTIEGGPGEQRVVEFVLPGGLFAIDAKLEISSTGKGDICSLEAASTGLLDETDFSEGEQIALQGVFENSGGSSRVRVSCDADDQIKIGNAKLRAFQVGEIAR